MDVSKDRTISSRTLSSGSSTAKTSLDLSILASEGGFGITTLYEGSENPTVDVVAVHGLRAHPINSWKMGGADGVMWLSHLLPQDLPNARIMVYGYNSNLSEDASTRRIRDFAKGLLNDLDDYRTEEQRERPIIYVCHSLGGLVVKQALVIAQMERIYHHLKTATYGIVFLGTPHRGSSTANLAMKVASMVKVIYPGIRTEIIKSLQTNSYELEDLADNFRHLHSEFEIVSFYETEPKKGVGLIVDKESAVLGVEGERQVAMEANHSRMRKFTGANDLLYIKVSKCIQRLAKAAPDAVGVKFNVENITRATTMQLELGIQGGFLGESKTVRIFDLPGLLTPCFTGRDSILNQLHNMLQAPTKAETTKQDCIYYRRAAIYGMPGSGKTQLALKYASAYREQYSAVFFVSAARKSTLSDGYERIISLLDLPEKSRTEPAIKIAAARTWFENSRSHDGKNWLLVVDNINPEIVDVEDQIMDDLDATVTDLVRDFLPREGTSPRGSILLTTRKPRIAETVVGSNSNLCIGLGEMDKKDAVDLLLRASGQANGNESAETIVKELGYHPLAINQAAALMKVADIDCENFLENFHDEKDELLDFSDPDSPQQNASTAKVYQMAFGGLDQKAPVSADIFRLFSFFDPESIPLSLLTEGSRGLPENIELSKIIKSPFKLLLALANMRSGSLAKELGSGKEKIFWIHDLVQYLCRQWLEPMERRKWAERAIDVVASAYPDSLSTLETWRKAKKYLKHGQSCTEHAAALHIQTVNLADLMIRMSWFLRQTGDLIEAVRLASRAVDCAKIFGEGQHQHMDAASNLGLMYYTQSRLKEAHKQWISALEMGKKLLGSPGYVDTGIGNNLALIYYQEGRFDEAEEHHLRLYERKKVILGEHHPETLGAMGSVANTYHFQGRLKEAVELKKQILEERTKYMGEQHPETLGAKGSLATSYSDQGLLEKAEELQHEVMVGRENHWGKQNPEYLSAKGSLSYTFYLKGLRDKAYLQNAEKYQLEVRDERVKLWGEQHVETLGAMRHLAKTYYAQGRLDEAVVLQENVLFGMGQLLGDNHPGTLSVREELSTTYHDQGLVETAKRLREVVATEREKLWGNVDRKKLLAMEAFSRKYQGFAH